MPYYKSKNNTIYYAGERDKEKQSISRYILRLAKKLAAINLLGGHCKSCGEDRFWVLQFHHIKDKKHGIHAIQSCSWVRIKNEINNCELLCENCHRGLTGIKTLERSAKNKLLLLNFKRTLSCEKCSFNKFTKALDFHHTGEKTIDISNLISYTWNLKITSKIADELNKCVVLCANCHREIHFDIIKFNKYKNDIEKRATNLQDSYSNKIDREKLFKLYNEGFSQYRIARKLDCSESSVCTILKEILSNAEYHKYSPKKDKEILNIGNNNEKD